MDTVCFILGPSLCKHGMVYTVSCTQGRPITCTSYIYLTSGQTIIAQKERDDRITELVKTVGDTYTFVHAADALKIIDSQKQIIMSLTAGTIQCSYFIRDYAKNKSFCMLVPTLSGADSHC